MVTKTDPVEVKFSADTSSLKEGTSVASNSVKEAIDRINTSVVGMGQSITTNTAIGGQALQGMAATVTTAMGSIGTVINAVLLPITLLIAAWNTLSGAIEAASDEAAQVRSLMNAFGMASDEAGKLNVALQLLGLSSEEYIGIAMKFNRQLRNNEDGMNALGVKTRDNNGNLLSQQELLRNALTTMLDYKAGVDRNAYAQANFGRSAEDAYKFLRLNDEALARGAEMAKKYGLVMSGDALEGMKQYKLEMNAIKVLTDEFKERLGEALIPVLTKLAQLFIQLASAVLPAFSKAMEYAAIGLDVYASLMEIWVTLVKTGFEVVTLSVMTFANTAASALRFDGQATATWERGMEQIKNAVLRRAAEIATLSGDLKKKLFDRAALSDDPVMPLGSGKNLTYSGQDKQDKSSRMPAFEEQLTQAKLLYQEQNNLREMSKQQEKAFWQEIAATHKLSKEEQLAIDKTIASLQIEINKKIFKDKQDLLKAEIESSERAALAKVKIAEEASRMEVERGKKTKLEDIAAQADFENERYAIMQNAQAQRIALAEQDPDNPVERQKQLDRVTEIYQAHQLQIQKIQTSAVKENIDSYEKMLAPITNVISGSVAGMIAGTQTLQQAMRNLMTNLLGSFTAMLAEMAKKWIAQQMAEFSIAQMFTSLKQALFGAAAASTVSTKAAEATAVVGANAAEGASGAAASVSAIPMVGWMMAAGVFASTMALILGAKSAISASGGYDVPSGVNPMAQLHAREMVLPASQADVVRNMASNGGGGASSVNFNVTAMDGDSVKKFFAQNKAMIAQGIKDSMRNGTNLTLKNKYGRM